MPTVSIIEEAMRQARRSVALALLGAGVTAAMLFGTHLWSSTALLARMQQSATDAPVNDRYGHLVGDLMLKKVAQRLARCLRSSDLRARYGGDECEGPGTARAAAERIVERLTWPMNFCDVTVNIGASVGIARFPNDADTDDELLRKADSALYRAKQDGRGGV